MLYICNGTQCELWLNSLYMVHFVCTFQVTVHLNVLFAQRLLIKRVLYRFIYWVVTQRRNHTSASSVIWDSLKVAI